MTTRSTLRRGSAAELAGVVRHSAAVTLTSAQHHTNSAQHSVQPAAAESHASHNTDHRPLQLNTTPAAVTTSLKLDDVFNISQHVPVSY